jgi:hypothetical protein
LLFRTDLILPINPDSACGLSPGPVAGPLPWSTRPMEIETRSFHIQINLSLIVV